MCGDSVCCLKPSGWDVAHNIARTDGGDMTIENLRVSCPACNRYTGTLHFDDEKRRRQNRFASERNLSSACTFTPEAITSITVSRRRRRRVLRATATAVAATNSLTVTAQVIQAERRRRIIISDSDSSQPNPSTSPGQQGAHGYD
jgi:hypothetical protein